MVHTKYDELMENARRWQIEDAKHQPSRTKEYIKQTGLAILKGLWVTAKYVALFFYLFMFTFFKEFVIKS